MKQCFEVVLGLLVILGGCGGGSSDQSGGMGGTGGAGGAGGIAPRACATDIGVGEVQGFGMSIPARTEGITFDAQGNLFVSALFTDGDDQLLAVATDGSFAPVAQAPSILGLASSANGILAAAIETGELLLIDPNDGSIEVVAENLGAPNFVLPTPWGTILVSDDSAGEDTIDEVTSTGEVSTWVQGVPTPNGMVLSLDGRTLYVASTFEEPGLWRVPVSESGEAETPEKWVSFDLTTPDGVAIDAEGNVYVALNITGQIAKVAPDGTSSIFAEGVSYAASLAFGQGDFDPCSIYATTLFDTGGDAQMFRIGVGVPGPPN